MGDNSNWPPKGTGGGGGVGTPVMEIPDSGSLPGGDDGNLYLTKDDGLLYYWNAADGAFVVGDYLTMDGRNEPVYINFNDTPGVVGFNEGRLYWNNIDKTLNMCTDQAGVILQIGQEQMVRVTNKSGALIPDGSPVYVSGADATTKRPTIEVAQANSFLALRLKGMTTQAIANNADGLVTISGRVRGLNLSAFSIGDPIWLSESVAGGFRNTKPAAPNYSIILGTVGDNAVSGTLDLDFRIGSTLSSASDADITGLADRDILQYDLATSTWKNVLNSPLQTVIGMSQQRPTTVIREAAGTLYADLENRDGGGDILYFFQNGNYTLDCTTGAGIGGKATVALTAGASYSAPVKNYLYTTELAGVVTLNASTAFPTGEFCWVGETFVPDATSFLTRGVYNLQNTNDAVENPAERGCTSYEREKLRALGTIYDSGVVSTTTITPGSPDTIKTETTAGSIYQLHKQTFPAFTGAPKYYVVNDSVNPYLEITDWADLLTDALGGSLSGRRFNLVLWGSVSADGQSKLYINLPSGSYGNNSDALADTNGTAVTTVPSEMKGTAFLIGRFVFRHQTVGGGTWTNIASADLGINNIDLRGQTPGFNVTSSVVPAVTQFLDTLFKILDDADNTKAIAFQASGITTGTTRTYTAPDKDGTLALLDDVTTATAALYAATQIVSISSDTALTDQAIHKVDNTSARALTMDPAATKYTEVKGTGGSAIITITPNTGLIEGAASYQMLGPWESIRIFSDLTNLFIV